MGGSAFSPVTPIDVLNGRLVRRRRGACHKDADDGPVAFDALTEHVLRHVRHPWQMRHPMADPSPHDRAESPHRPAEASPHIFEL